MEHSTAQLNSENDVPLLWNLSLFSFVVAGITGFSYRLGMIGRIPLNLSMENIRHAHSHLMLFGWAVPLPLYVVFRYLRPKLSGNVPAITLMRNSIAAGLFLGLLAYPFFLLFGYQPVPIGSTNLPLSVILAGFVMVSWYCFMVGYLKARNVLANDSIQPWFDSALVMLLVCSLGAWGVALLQAIDPTNQLLVKAMTHFFLATFTEGWVVLIVVAVVLSRIKKRDIKWPLSPHLLIGCIVLGAPLTFPYGISKSILPSLLLGTARFGGALTALSLVLILFGVLRTQKLKTTVWIWPIGLLGFKALMQLAAAILPSSFWLADHGLQIFYLHVLLLGALTLTISGFLYELADASRVFFNLFAGAVTLAILSLILLTRFWPQIWSGPWIFKMVAAVAILPVLAAMALWIKLIKTKQNEVYA
ncbi:MAG TPA: hypothetical protein VJ964_04880 [Balneolaceae bacterium]|nr:hypothetical protein [Balneolaceae bacterium]